MTFDHLGLAQPILRAIADEGYTIPTPIQIKAIPHVLAGRDVLGCAQTGSGKTAAFAMPILQRLSGPSADQPAPRAAHADNGHRDHGRDRGQDKAHRRIRALVLCPTRELASQIADSFAAYGRHLPLRHIAIFGGVNQHHQVKALKNGLDILIATPGRLLDLINQGFIDLRTIEVFVLDEADRMLDMGFIPDIRKIVKRLPPRESRQTLMFSATMPADIRGLADSILHQPVPVAVDPGTSTVQTVSQSVYFVERKSKGVLLKHLLKNWRMGRTLVFTRTKHGADKVVKELERSGIRAQAIHGNKSQNNRTRALNAFKSNTPPVLVATDIASRGIDVDEITHVINFDMPNVPETYIHRIGRTARAGASGVAVSFCDGEERQDLKAIEKLIQQRIEVKHEASIDLSVTARNGHDKQDQRDQHAKRDQLNQPNQKVDRGSAAKRGQAHRGWSQAARPAQAPARASHPIHHAENRAAQPERVRPQGGFQGRGRGKPKRGGKGGQFKAGRPR